MCCIIVREPLKIVYVLSPNTVPILYILFLEHGFYAQVPVVVYTSEAFCVFITILFVELCNNVAICYTTQNNTIHQVTTKLAISKNVVSPGHEHHANCRYPGSSTDDPSLKDSEFFGIFYCFSYFGTILFIIIIIIIIKRFRILRNLLLFFVFRYYPFYYYYYYYFFPHHPLLAKISETAMLSVTKLHTHVDPYLLSCT